MALSAPRILKDPMGWRFSSLIESSTGTSTSRRISGVRTAVPRMRARAAATSAALGASMRITRASEIDHDAGAALEGARVNELRGGDVFDGKTQRLEQRD